MRLGDWKFRSENKIGKRILVEDANSVQVDAVTLEIKPIVPRMYSVNRLFPS